jgi:chromosome segregation ATPase
MTEAATLETPPAEAGSARAQLQAAHQDLAGCTTTIARLRTTQQDRASHVAKLRATLASAKAEADRIRQMALADPSVTSKPSALVNAEDAVAEAQGELEFAEGRLRQTEHELTAAEAARNKTQRSIRAAAQQIAAERAVSLALNVSRIEAEAIFERTALRGLVAALMGMGVRFSSVVVEVYRTPPPPEEPIVNSPEWRRERSVSQAWRTWIEAALKDPDAPLPEED